MSSSRKVAKVESYDQEVLDELMKVEEKVEAIEEDFRKEELELLSKYDKKKFPLYQERAKYIAKIPNFWATAIDNHPILSNWFENEKLDVLLLEYLEDVLVEKAEKSKTIKMTFKDNPFFSNKTLSKKFTMAEDESECSVEQVKWKQGKAPAAIKEDEEYPFNSFFQWFEHGVSKIVLEMAEILTEDFYPNAVKYFLDITGDDDDEEDEEDDLEDDEEDEDLEDEDDE